MQTLLRDQHDHTAPSFLICKRTLQRCQELIFTDAPANSSPYASTANVILPKKIFHHAEPAFVGIGMILAGAPALPVLASVMGPVAVEQGRVEDQVSSVERRVDDEDDDDGRVARVPPLTEENNTGATEEDDEDQDASSEPSMIEPPQAGPVRAGDEQSPSLYKVSPLIRSLLRRRSTISAAQTSPSLIPARLSEDPFGQNDYANPSPPVLTPSQSSPSLPNMKHKRNATSEHLLQRYSADIQCQMLRSYYCRSEVRDDIQINSLFKVRLKTTLTILDSVSSSVGKYFAPLTDHSQSRPCQCASGRANSTEP
jgi:phosphatidylinositol 4-kinase B